MHPVWIWVAALVAYAAFSGWYWNWRGPLSKQEIDAGIAALERTSDFDTEQAATMRAFLEADDGREFLMLNLLRLQPGPVTPPGGGPPQTAQEVVQRYAGPFMSALFRRAGHPAFLGRAVGGYVEQWGVEKNPGWTAGAAIRYRSRRDVLAMATMPEFEGIHAFKKAGLSNTLAFPIQPVVWVVSPVFVAPLVFSLLAALGHLALRALVGTA
jgi:hypothetical protein